MLDNLLIQRLAIINLIGAVLLGFAWQRGLVMPVLDGDSTRLVYVMIALFLVFQVSLFIRAAKVSALLNMTKRKAPLPVINGVKFLEKMAHLDEIPDWLVTLGLLGTVIGVSIALFGVDQNSLGSPEGVKAVVTGLIGGMQVALYTTIVGGVLGFWCSINRRILRTASVVMIEDVRDLRRQFAFAVKEAK
ncbi:MAG: MotA/TolQ/ExbB proton channel family protein [Minisyncoccota bacterium]